jgi:adenosylhomocysteine nucleosidase
VTRRPLVVSATGREAAHVPPGFEVVVTGMGKTAAAVRTTVALAGRDPATVEVVNIGSAGALRDGLEGLFEVGSVLNHDISADALRALGHDCGELIELDHHGVDLASGDVFVTDPVVREQLAARAHLVDMEGYAVAYACRALGVPVRLVKHVSDNADASALDWASLVDRSARALGAWLAEEYPR